MRMKRDDLLELIITEVDDFTNKDSLHFEHRERIREEILRAEELEVIEELIVLYKLAIYLKANNIPYYFKGNSSNLYILYLLGISRVNPLNFNLSYENFFGIELEKSKLRLSPSNINMVVPTELYSTVLKRIKSEQILQNKEIEPRKYTFNIGKISIEKCDMPCEIKGYYSEIDYNDLLKFILEEYNDDDFINAIDAVFDCKSDISLTDAIKVYGLLHSTWEYEDKLSEFLNLDLPISEMPVFYDDVFDILLDNFSNKDAWKYADSIHWGHGLPQEVQEHLTQTIFNWCNSALYLFPRSHAIEKFIHNYKIERGNRMKITNLFSYATSELSQDAFICWLLSHLTAEGYNDDPEIRNCAIRFMSKTLEAKDMQWEKDMRITKIERQYNKIDVLVVVDDLYIIIEDKTFTDSHDDQINRYKNILLEKGYYGKVVKDDNVICVYYKIIEQAHPEKNVDFEFTRDILLEVFKEYKYTIKNHIFTDYMEYLESIDKKVNWYKYATIHKWDHDAYRGFFKELGNDFFKGKKVYNWGYVPNQTGGFMGLWWYDILSDMNEFHNEMKLNEDLISNLYLQIENDEITVKYSVDSDRKDFVPDYSKIKPVRLKMFEYFKKELGEQFKKKKYQNGKSMTVGYVKYENKEECIDILETLERLLKNMKYKLVFDDDK